MNLEIACEGAESTDIALGFFRAQLGWAFALVEKDYGISYDLDAALERAEAELPKFFPPAGRMLVARVDGRPVGIACLKAIGPEIGEVKHVYVEPRSRRLGLGRKLMEALIHKAQEAGYRILRLDSGRSQTGAHALYRSLGFVEIDRYPENPIPESEAHVLLFMELKLQ